MNKGGQSEVTNRLRSAIKKKLAEISDFEDEELPEYIMILVANQRSKSQIEKDLSLFLRNDTVSFTNWLWALLNSLNVGNKSQKGSLSTSDSKESKQNFDDDDAVIIDCGPDEQENDLLSPEESNDSFSRPSSRRSFSDHLENVLTEATECQSDKNKTPEKKLPSNIETNIMLPLNREKQSPSPKKCVPQKQEQILLKKKNINPLLLLNKTVKDRVNSKVVPIKRRLVNSDDEYDPSKPGYVNRSNKVPRNYSGPAALQANKLLLKAVDDATKSILVGQNIEDFYKPTPIKVLTSKRFKSAEPQVKNFETVIERNGSKIISNLDYNFDILKSSASNEQEYSNCFTDDFSVNSQFLPQASRRICLRPIPLVSDSPETTNIGFNPQGAVDSAINPIEEKPPKSPHFIVTLEGVNLSFKNKVKKNVDDNLDEIEEDHMSVDEYEDDPSPNEKAKVERCKYWPACKNSDNCIYHHPTIPCKCFPDCKFGDKCLYIHPNCKFDALCSRKDCPFTHASKRKLTPSTHSMRMVPAKILMPKMVCKYYPKCTATNCLFIHPKLCRYGKECRLPSCSFSHFSLPSRSQLKWKA